MKCYNCGATLSNDAGYCLSCGRKVGDSGARESDKVAIGAKETYTPCDRSRGVQPKIPYGMKLFFAGFVVLLLVLLLIALF